MDNPEGSVAQELPSPRPLPTQPIKSRNSLKLLVASLVIILLLVIAGTYYLITKTSTTTQTPPTSKITQPATNSTVTPAETTIQPAVSKPAQTTAVKQYCPNAFPGIDTNTPMASLLSATDLATAETALQMLASQYNGKILVGSFVASEYANRNATWSHLTSGDWKNLVSYGQLLICEWSKYPPDWIRQSKVASIAIVKNLAVKGQSRAAMPDSQGGTLFLDDGYSQSGSNYQQRVIHHEFYHLVEFANYGSMFYQDQSWSALNDQSFKYGNGGAGAYNDQNYANTEHSQSGFVTGYATSAIEEDKAESYAYLFVKESNQKLQIWLAGDSVLLNKINYLKKFILNRTSSMDSGYFQRINQ